MDRIIVQFWIKTRYTNETHICVLISHIEFSCNKLLMSVDFGMLAYLIFIIFGSKGYFKVLKICHCSWGIWWQLAYKSFIIQWSIYLCACFASLLCTVTFIRFEIKSCEFDSFEYDLFSFWYQWICNMGILTLIL